MIRYADIQLINADDVALFKRQLINEKDIKHMQIKVLLSDTMHGLYLNELILFKLQLSFVEKRTVHFADKSIQEYDMVGPVIIKFDGHQTVCNAIVLKDNSEPVINGVLLHNKPIKLPYIKMI